jgi:ribosomal protein L29
MRIHAERTMLTAAETIEVAQLWGRYLEQREGERYGGDLKKVRPAVARRIGVSPGTLENLRKGRLKAVAAHVYARLWEAIDNELRTELRHLESELAAHATRRLDVNPDEAAAIVADIARIRTALTRRAA